MSRDLIVVSFIDDAQFPNFNSLMFIDIDSAFKYIQSFKQFHKDNDSLYEIRMSFFDNLKDCREYIQKMNDINFIESV